MIRFAIILITVYLSEISAFAWTGSWYGGGSLIAGARSANSKALGPHFGVELTFGTPFDMEYGFAGDVTIATSKQPADETDLLAFLGGVFRIHLPSMHKNIFADGVLGISPRGSDGGAVYSALGLGVGYKCILGSSTSISPRLGYKLFPMSGGPEHTINLDVMFSLMNQSW